MEIRDRIKELRRVPARELVKNPRNWRRHPKCQADALRGLLGQIGYADAVLARELGDGRLMLIDGHLRSEVTPDAVIPVLVVDVNEEEADLLLATLDPLAAMATADTYSLEALLKSVQPEDEAVRSLLEKLRESEGLLVEDTSALIDPDPQIDKAEELRKKWRTEAGQLWEAGGNKIVCGDSRDPKVVQRLFVEGGRRLRMVWCDPPYGVSYSDKNEFLNSIDRGNRVEVRYSLRNGVRGRGAGNSIPDPPVPLTSRVAVRLPNSHVRRGCADDAV